MSHRHLPLIRTDLPLRNAGMPRWAWLAPLIAVALFVAGMIGMLVYLRGYEAEQRRQSLYKDAELAQQSVRLRLTTVQESMLTLSRDIAVGDVSEESVWGDTATLLKDYPFILALSWMETTKKVAWVRPSPSTAAEVVDIAARRAQDPETAKTFELVNDFGRPAWSHTFVGSDGMLYIELQVPVIVQRKPQGTLLAVMSVDRMLTALVPATVSQKYRVMFVDENEAVLASTSGNEPTETAISYVTPLDPPGHGISLRTDAYKTGSRLFENMLLSIVAGLSTLIIWSLATLWRHTQRRGAAEKALVTETAFRRAMEDSLSTGMRALDRQGRITYVNRAFCDMLGLSESDLLGQTAPFAYWPKEMWQEHHQALNQLLAGQTSVGGVQIQVQRADGTQFPVRMYVSPLIDENGVQTGWMTSMTDITEPTKARDELAATQKRFLTVLEQLDSAVSVRAHSVDDNRVELLFANRTYTELFGPGLDGHWLLARNSQLASSGAHEVFYEPGHAWFEVRERDIEWVDGRTVRLQVATDATTRHEAEEMSRSQQEKVQLTSRLITMGEMASSLAHELNQPLTAISNYSTGVFSRMQGGTVDPVVLLPVLKKTTEQAQRAGDIIRRIREFVKRSEPKRSQTDLRQVIEDAVGFAEIEAKRRNVKIRTELTDNLAPVFADRILIEQVLLNLLKNGVDSMKDSPLTGQSRHILLQVIDSRDEVEFRVTDRGHGIADKNKSRLFEPFFSTKSDGMGMGLNICRTIVEFHHGRLWVDDNPLGGAVFHFTLPRHLAA